MTPGTPSTDRSAMSTPFLRRFSTTVVTRMRAEGLLVVGPAGEAPVIAYVANALGSERHVSLVSTVSRALIACPDVEEVYGDDGDIKAIIDDMDARSAGIRG